MQVLEKILKSRRFEMAIAGLIIINAITLGLETSATIMQQYGPVLKFVDGLVLVVFVVEILAKLAVYRHRFFLDPWNLFDFIIVAIALMPASGAFSVMRALRILRVLRLISIVPTLKRVVGAFISALPGMGSIFMLMGLVFYVFAVMATKLFSASFPEWFGTLGASAYSLFQIMTLESWSMGIVRPVMEIYPYAWAFFVPFILCTTFTVLNLFIGVIVSAMQEEHESIADADRQAIHDETALVLQELKALRTEIADLKKGLKS
ncbi:MAG: ion transporter [Rhizobiales bacterium]|nr:ion transporter [Hyphomicrobiales bacterium]